MVSDPNNSSGWQGDVTPPEPRETPDDYVAPEPPENNTVPEEPPAPSPPESPVEEEEAEDEDDIEEYSVGEAWERAKESGRRFRKAVLYPAIRTFKNYVDKSLDATDDLADGFKGKKKKDR